MSSGQSVGQDGPATQAQNELSDRRNSTELASTRRRRKIFWVSIVCWLMILCVTAIIIIAVVHFQNSKSNIDQMSAGALIGFGVLLIFVLLWSGVIYFKFYRSKSRRDPQQYRPNREEFVAFASNEIVSRGVSSTISTNNSATYSRSTNSSAEGINPERIIYRERRYDDERRYNDERRVIDQAVETPIMTSIPSASRMTREYIDRQLALVGRSHATHPPERQRTEAERPRIIVDSNRAPPRQHHRHSVPMPPPYQPQVVPSYRASASLPAGTPPPAYDRVCGRRNRRESTASEDSQCLSPPAYQSRPPSPSGGISQGVDTTNMYLNVPSQRPRLVVGRPVSMQFPVENMRRYEVATSQPRQQLSLPSTGRILSENAIYPVPSRARRVSPPAIQTTAITSMAPYHQPQHRSSASPHYHVSPHLPNSASLPPLALARGPPSSPTRQPVSPPYPTAHVPFSLPVLALGAPESTSRLSLTSNRPPSPIQEATEDNQEENENNKIETPPAATSEVRRPSVVLVYLSQSPEEDIVV